MFVVYVYTGHVIWDDAVTASSPGYYWWECCYNILSGFAAMCLLTSVCEPRYIMAGRDRM